MQETKRDKGLILGLGRPPGGGHGNPFHYSCLENPMERGAWQATVHGVTKSWTNSTPPKLPHTVKEEKKKEEEILVCIFHFFP